MLNITTNVSARFSSFISDWDYLEYLLFGGYGSGKSHAIAQKIIFKLLKEKRTALVLREVFETMRESCFLLFKSVLDDMGLLADTEEVRGKKLGAKRIAAVTSPMEIRFPNGSRIIFKGLDNPEKLKSIVGVSIVWIEECSEIREAAYMELLGRIRTPGVTKHFILSCNPVGKENWIYKHFFRKLDNKGKEVIIQDEEEVYKRRTLVNKKNGVYYSHSVPDDNPFLDGSYIKRLDRFKEVDKHLWVVARWGRFGTEGLRVLPNFVIAANPYKFKQAVYSIPSRLHFFGIDFGFEDSFNAIVACCVDEQEEILYIYDEVYMNHVTDDRFADMEGPRRMASRSARCEKTISADNAEPKTIKYYRQKGYPIRKCKKFPGSRLQYTKKVKRFRKIICSPRCINCIREMQTLTYAVDKNGNRIYDEFNIDPHTFSALWYALDEYEIDDLKETNTRAG